MAPIRATGRKRHERGAALVEFALCVPLLLIVIAGIVDFGFAFQRYEVITNAAREGARMASLPVGYSEDEIKARVRDYIQAGLSLSPTALDTAVPLSNITVDYPDLTIGSGSSAISIDTARVTVAYHHNWLLLRPLLGLINKSWGESITLTATSRMRREPGSGI